MTVRAVHYRLVAAQVIQNTRTQYQAVSDLLVKLRRSGAVPWEWVEDHLREPHEVSTWNGLSDFFSSVGYWYRRDVWATQPIYLECWLEKDALSGLFDGVLQPYGITLNVGRGFDGWTSIHNAAQRFAAHAHTDVVLLYFGDFDPSGEDIARSLQARLEAEGATFELVTCALRREDVEQYNLPHDFTKKTDTRAAKFVAKHGDMAVELDALPVEILKARIVEEVEARVDMRSLARVREQEAGEIVQLRQFLKGWREE
jgi:hypothetical protein